MMQTIDEVKANPEFMNGVEITEYDFSIFLLYLGSENLKYYAFWHGTLLFQGDKKLYRHAFETSCKLIQELTTTPADVSVCTPMQTEWYRCDHCRELNGKVKAFFDYRSPGRGDAITFFKMRFVS
jgi:hypothetical protein